MCLIPNFGASRDLLISFMLSLISECWGPACFVLTRWNFLCGETYTADSLHQLKTDLCLQRKKKKQPPPFSFLLSPSNIGFVIPTEYLLSAGTGCSPQTTQEFSLNWVVQTQLFIELFSAGAAQRQLKGAVTSRVPGACFPHRGAVFPALPHGCAWSRTRRLLKS